MKTYVRVQDGVVAEIIQPMSYDADSPEGVDPGWKQGDEIPIGSRYTDAVVNGPISTMVDISSIDPMPEQNWSFDGTTFSAPVAYQPTSFEIKVTNTATRDALLEQATIAIAPLQDAVDLNMATDADTAAMKAWKTYRVLVNRIDLTLASPQWPQAPQS